MEYALPNKKQVVEYALPNKKQCSVKRANDFQEDIAIESEHCTRQNNPSEMISNEVNQHPFIDTTLKGSFHQGDVQFSYISRGNQCTCNALLALCTLPEIEQPKTTDLDQVLLQGDHLYNQINVDRKHRRSSWLCLDELPYQIPIEQPLYTVRKYVPLHVNIQRATTTRGLTYSLHDALSTSFERSDKVLLMTGEYAVALFKRGTTYFLFDSHSKDEVGQMTPFGTSILLTFLSLRKCEQFLLKFCATHCTAERPMCEFVPVSIGNFADSDAQLTNYMADQFNLEQISKAKRQYNKNYKQMQRQNTDFRKKELEQEVRNKKLARLNSEVKEKERLAKKQEKSNPDFRKKELEQEVHNKKLARLNSDVKEKELEKKRTARLNSEVKEKERLAKKQERSNPDFRKKELEQEVHNKKLARLNSEVKEKERLAKKQDRSNPDFRKKELEQEVHNKKLARLNSEVKEKERLAKKQERSNPDFRKKELEQEVLIMHFLF